MRNEINPAQLLVGRVAPAITEVVLRMVVAVALLTSTALVAVAIALSTDRSCEVVRIGTGTDCHWQLPECNKCKPKKFKPARKETTR